MPRLARRRQIFGLRLDDFLAENNGATEIRPQPRVPAFGSPAPGAIPHRKTNAIPDKPVKPFPRCWFHDWRQIFHAKVLAEMRKKANAFLLKAPLR
jgi:hypothetical protein